MSGPVLFLDTETSGLVRRDVPLTHESQPRIASIGLLLATRERRLASFTALIRPSGWEMPPEAAAVNGLSTELCQRFGVTFEYAWHVLVTLAVRAERICCHNVAFDRAMLDIERGRAQGLAYLPPEKPWFCTKVEATSVCKLPKPGGAKGYKWPTLAEAHQHFCGGPVEGAHDALADAEACARVYWRLVPAPAPPAAAAAAP